MYAIPIAVTTSSWFVASLFDVMCSSAVCGVVEETFKRLYMFVALCILVYAYNHPFKDIAMYTVPLMVALSAWFLSTLIDVSCRSDSCQRAENALERVYLYILVSLLLLAWKNFRGTFSYFKDVVKEVVSKEKTA